MLKKINPVRFIALAAFIILLLGVFCSLYFTDPNVYKSVIPYPTIIIPVINISIPISISIMPPTIVALLENTVPNFFPR